MKVSGIIPRGTVMEPPPIAEKPRIVDPVLPTDPKELQQLIEQLMNGTRNPSGVKPPS